MKIGPVAVASLTIAFAQPQVVCAEFILERTHRFDIAAGQLDVALLEFSKQAHVAVSTDGELLRHHRTRGMKGTQSAKMALEILLRESGLTFRLVGNAVLIVRPASVE